MGLDDMTHQIHETNAAIKVVGLVDAGFFPDYNYNEKLSYGHDMRRIFHDMEMQAGVNKKCLLANSGRPSNCVFGSYLLPHISTPLFMIQVSSWFAHDYCLFNY
jgi:hypothetical protein